MFLRIYRERRSAKVLGTLGTLGTTRVFGGIKGVFCPQDVAVLGTVLGTSHCVSSPPTFDLSSVATGDSGLRLRKLCTDTDVVQMKACTPIMINGIPDVIGRPDLRDRCILISLPMIDSEHRKTPDELNAYYEANSGKLLGVLCNAISSALANRKGVTVTNPSRMAGFEKWVVAGVGALGVSQQYFIEKYRENQEAGLDAVLEENPIMRAIVELMDTCESWEGNMTALVVAIRNRAVIFGSPSAHLSPERVARMLARNEHILKKAGFTVSKTKSDGTRLVRIERIRPVTGIDTSALYALEQPPHWN